MIILEGADGVGKTTAAWTMCKYLQSLEATPPSDVGHTGHKFYGHMSRPPEDFDHLSEYMDRVRYGVQDRFHLGSIVYGYILGGGTYPSPQIMRVVQRYLVWQGCYVIIFHAQRHWLKQHMQELLEKRNEMYRLDQILDANDAFRGLLCSSNRGEPYAHAGIDVTDGKFPDEATLKMHVEIWRKRFA